MVSLRFLDDVLQGQTLANNSSMAQWVSRVRSWLFTPASCEGPPLPEVKRPEEAQGGMEDFENPAFQEMNRRFPLRPPTFEMLLQGLRALTMIEPLDGLKVDFGMGLSPRFQFSNSWTMPHGQPGSFDMTLVFLGGKVSTNPYERPNPDPVMVSRFSVTQGRQDVKVVSHPTENLEMRLSANYMSSNVLQSQMTVEADYSGEDYVAGGKVGVNLDLFSYYYMQSVTSNLVLGFELMNMVRQQEMLGLSYGLKYSLGENNLYMQYLTYARSLTVGTLIKGNKNINFFTEFNYNTMTGESEFMSGLSIRFTRARMQAIATGAGKITAMLQHSVNMFVKIGLQAEVDLVNQDQKFGIALNLGG